MSDKAYGHVMTLMSAGPQDSTLRLCLAQNGYNTFLDLCLLTQEAIDLLMVTKDKGEVKQLFFGWQAQA
jgi:hypothetical protein